MRAALVIEDDRIIIAVEGRGLYRAGKTQVFGETERAGLPEATGREAGAALFKVKQGRELYAFIPKSFHKLIKKKSKSIQSEGLVLFINDFTLAELAWEFVPIYGADRQFHAYWHELPLMRSISGSTHCERVFAGRNVRTCFYNVGLLSDNVMAAHNIDVDIDVSVENEISGLKEMFIGHLGLSDFVHIASHGTPDAFVYRADGADIPYCAPVDIARLPAVPRAALADCCHSAEMGPARDWGWTMPDAFIRKNGAAIYIGNLGAADYSAGRTAFAENFIRLFLQGDNIKEPFAETVWQVRKAQSGDRYNSQVVYVAADFDVKRPSAEILTDRRILAHRAKNTAAPAVMAAVCCVSLFNQILSGFDAVTLAVSLTGLAAVNAIGYLSRKRLKKMMNGEITHY